jgi:hypothetical protein
VCVEDLKASFRRLFRSSKPHFRPGISAAEQQLIYKPHALPDEPVFWEWQIYDDRPVELTVPTELSGLRSRADLYG